MQCFKSLALGFAVFVVTGLTGCLTQSQTSDETLASWKTRPDGARDKIIQFVQKAVKCYPPEKRVAVFDMDGTLICEKPMYVESYFAVAKMAADAQMNPDLLKQPYYTEAVNINQGDFSKKTVDKFQSGIPQCWLTAFANMDETDFVKYVADSKGIIMHPRTKQPLSQTFYKPMLEFIKYLKDNDFKVYIVSGTSTGAVRGMCKGVIKLKNSHLIGTEDMLNPVYYKDKAPKLIRTSVIRMPRTLRDGKTTVILDHIGVRPILAVGNTVDDFGMLQYTCSGSTPVKPRMGMLVNHDDAVREYVYPGYGTPMVPLKMPGDEKLTTVKADPAVANFIKSNGWITISVKNDFTKVFPSITVK
ncbi:MAG: haloacid dehalogenase-like hydrolase [Lentisphaerae bacterium]|nr:haloacid dehalogenase-like hydrolase [Lentisphaerota bacterium]MCP4101762.1 haloacid dehalogenase-like hydrolase [Lentisphaerota bacterium]